MVDIIDVHLFNLPSQGNIYTLSPLIIPRPSCPLSTTNTSSYEPYQLLVGTLSRSIFLMGFMSDFETLSPFSKELQFTYIPPGAEVISLDSFHRTSKQKNQSPSIVIGITIVKTDETFSSPSSSTYFNIYNDSESSEHDFNLENLTQSCQMLELNFIPYQLSHALIESKNEIVWLLSGSDFKIHCYSNENEHFYRENEIGGFFPELEGPQSSIVLWFDIIELEGSRFTVLGLECGTLKLTKTLNGHISYSQKLTFDGPITSLKFFSPLPSLPFTPIGLKSSERNQNDSSSSSPPQFLLYLAVMNSFSPSLIFTDVIQSGLNEYCFLPRSEDFDIPTSVLMADIDCDGEIEVLVGTYGQQLLTYKAVRETGIESWTLVKERRFSAPVLSLRHIDVTGDGLRELIVMTTRGVQVMQHELNGIQSLVKQRILKLKEN